MARNIRFEVLLGTIALVALVVRLAYVLLQPGTDPAFSRPMLDGAYYFEWAQSLAAGGSGPAAGAYYLAPLYPIFLWGFFELAGDNFSLLYFLQQTTVVGTACLLALAARRLVGSVAGLAAAALLLLYHPLLYFPSRPVGESLALLLLVLAIYLVARRRPATDALGGAAVGVASLARPNLPLVVLVWAGSAAFGRRWASAALLAAGALLVISPVVIRNWVVSGHPVPISANAGLTLYHGNGPQAKGYGMLPPGLSGRLQTQQAEATALAGRLAGEPLDSVEADRWWGRRAVEARLADPVGTVALLGRRLALLVANAELSLDYAPAIDANPLRRAAPLPFCALLGLAAAAVWFVGFRGSGGSTVWGAILACAAAPVLIYASSRYRLPVAALICLPAGVGIAAIVRPPDDRRRWVGVALGLACAGLSVLVPTGHAVDVTEAVALANRAVAWAQLDRYAEAEADFRRALEQDPESVPALFGLGVLLESEERLEEAREFYRRAVARNPANVEAAGNLARLLMITGRAREAVPILRRALRFQPGNRTCWDHLLAALFMLDDVHGAREAVREAAAHGVVFDATRIRDLEGFRP